MSPYCGTAQLIMKRNLSGRIAVLVIGLWIMSLGIAFSIAAGLGTSPISSLPYTLSMLTPLTVGTATIMLHVILITLQALILRHRYRPIQLLQLPLAVLFGLLTDASNAMLGFLSPSSYLGSWLFCLIGIILESILDIPLTHGKSLADTSPNILLSKIYSACFSGFLP